MTDVPLDVVKTIVNGKLRSNSARVIAAAQEIRVLTGELEAAAGEAHLDEIERVLYEIALKVSKAKSRLFYMRGALSVYRESKPGKPAIVEETCEK